MGAPFDLGRPTKLAQKLRSNATDTERRLWKALRGTRLEGYKFSRQIPIAGFVCDFVCRAQKLVIEVDGGQHDWQSEQDALRTLKIEAQGYRVIRFWNNDVNERLEGVLLQILDALQPCAHPPTPSRKREGELQVAPPSPPLPLAGGDRGVGARPEGGTTR